MTSKLPASVNALIRVSITASAKIRSAVSGLLRSRNGKTAMRDVSPFAGAEVYDGYILEGHEPRPGSEPTQAQLQIVTPGYFHALGMSLPRGRDISDGDQEKTPMVAVVDDTLVRRYWPDGDAIGKRVRTTGDPTWFTIVGVVNGIKESESG